MTRIVQMMRGHPEQPGRANRRNSSGYPGERPGTGHCGASSMAESTATGAVIRPFDSGTPLQFMKNAKVKLTKEAAASRGWKQIEQDHMPVQVATDLLCTLERMTLSQRKTFLDARATSYCAIEEKKPRDGKLSRKYREATLLQLGKWNRRANKRRSKLQLQYEVAIKLPEETTRQQVLKNRLVAGLDLAAARVDQVTDGTRADLERRSGVTRGKEGDTLQSWRGKLLAWTEGSEKSDLGKGTNSRWVVVRQ
jgi:hypothetical protein